LQSNKNHRSRTVSFRLSQEEYESLKNASAMRGARSVSEFTRAVACQNSAGDGDEIDAIVEILRRIINRMNAIERNIEKLIQDTEETRGKQQAFAIRFKSREKMPQL
jgi:uncharacterized protein (DUF1778 family)